jgi:hypothetical protein
LPHDDRHWNTGLNRDLRRNDGRGSPAATAASIVIATVSGAPCTAACASCPYTAYSHRLDPLGWKPLAIRYWCSEQVKATRESEFLIRGFELAALALEDGGWRLGLSETVPCEE